MSALAMILTATMVVPGDGPEKVSGEIAEPLRLDLCGEWEGELLENNSRPIEKIKISRGRECIEVQGKKMLDAPLKIIREGEGMLRWEVMVAGKVEKFLGIYKWQSNRLFICLRREDEGRPTNFVAHETNCLLILHRVKSRK